jgi:DNA-binding transcriptional ArsR family regulator
VHRRGPGAAATAANSNIAASLTRALDGMRPLAVDVAGKQLETAGVVARLEDGREVVVDLADIRKALAVEIQDTTVPQSDQTLEAAE